MLLVLGGGKSLKNTSSQGRIDDNFFYETSNCWTPKLHDRGNLFEFEIVKVGKGLVRKNFTSNVFVLVQELSKEDEGNRFRV